MTQQEKIEKIDEIKNNLDKEDIEKEIIEFLDNYNYEKLGTISNAKMENIIYTKIYKTLDSKQKIEFLKRYMLLFIELQEEMLEEINEIPIETRKQFLKIMDKYEVYSYIKNLSNEEEMMECLEFLERKEDIISIITNLSLENKMKYAEYFGKNYENMQIIDEFSAEEKEIFIQNTSNIELKVQTIVEMLKRNELKIEELYQYIEEIEDVNAKALIIANISVEKRHRIFSEVEMTVQDKIDITNKVNLIDEIAKKNEDIYFFLDYKMLEDKYLITLGRDKISQISCYPEIEDLFLQLEEKELRILKRCIDDHFESTQSDDWTEIAKDIVENIVSGNYDKLIENIEDIDQIDIDKLSKLLQTKNVFDIKTLEDFNNYEKIKKNICDQYIKSDNIENKKMAICEKFFGHDYEYAKEIVKKYGVDVEKLPDSNIKDYILSLKLLIKYENTKILEELYEGGRETLFVDKNYIERELRDEFCKMYNKGLLQIKDTKQLSDNIYEVQGDFSMIIHSVGAFVPNNIKNFKEDWNRKKIESQYFSTCYITSEKIRVPYINNVCYGFVDMAEGSLAMAGSTDLYTETKSFIPEGEHGDNNEKYYTPSTLIKNTGIYNELLYRRVQKGEKKKPSYIILFKKDGKIEERLKIKALRASEEWKDENGNNMPIVIVDIDKYKNKEEEKNKDLDKNNKDRDDIASELNGIKSIHEYFNTFNEEGEGRE